MYQTQTPKPPAHAGGSDMRTTRGLCEKLSALCVNLIINAEIAEDAKGGKVKKGKSEKMKKDPQATNDDPLTTDHRPLFFSGFFDTAANEC